MALEIKENQWLWMPHEEEVWIPVKPVATYGDTIGVEDKDGSAYQLKNDGELRVVQPNSMEALDDMINLHELFDGAILNTLRDRYADDKIYTMIASIVIAVNPYKSVPHLYNKDTQTGYRKKELEAPHVYSIGDNAYNGLLQSKMSQAIIVSGESGSGKTETTKILLRYLSFCSGQDSDIEKKVVDANPIVEAFGNAQTVRNHNSSRFGKWVEIHFNKDHAISGGSVKSFLLEVARVFKQDKGERNFHIFYQMCAGLKDNDRYHLKPPEEFKYLNAGECVAIAGLDENAAWKETTEAMNTLNFAEADTADIFDIVAAVMHLGNIEFESIENDTKSKITDASMQHMQWVAELLKVDASKLEECLLQRVQQFSKFEKAVTMFFKPEQASAARDALSRFLYSSVFDFVIAHCNVSMQAKNGQDQGGMVGVLDIFGFECFPINRFEQLCINYTNERLQQHFNHHVFVLEKEVYVLEGVEVDDVNFADNQGCIDLIDKAPNGIFPMLDEELVLPEGSDENFAQRLKQAHKGNEYFAVHRVRVQNQFHIQHYAGSVTYEVNGFMEKNRNEVPKDLKALAASSTVCARNILPAEEEQKGVMGRAKKKKTSIGTVFKQNLKQLMDTLNKSVPHFIRCLKPNAVQGPDKFDAPLVNEQLRYSGVQAVVEIRQCGFPFRFFHKHFYHKFKICSLDREEEKVMNALDGAKHKEVCQAFCDRLKCLEEGWRVGTTKVLVRAAAYERLEQYRKWKIEHGIAKIQGTRRRKAAQAKVKSLKEANKTLLQAIKGRSLEDLRNALFDAKQAGLMNYTYTEGLELFERLRVEKALHDRIETMLHSLTDFSVDDANRLIAEVIAVGYEHRLLSKLKLRVVHEKINHKLQEAIASGKEAQLTAAIDEADAGGMTFEDPEEYPFAVKAFRLRLRLRSQADVEAKLKAATASRNREQISKALKRAQSIDLPHDIESHAALLDISAKLNASKKALEKAVEQRDLEALIVALSEERDLGQSEEDSVKSATVLLGTVKELDNALTAALNTSEFNAVMKAKEAAEIGQIKCKAFDQAKVFVQKHVHTTMKLALKNAREPEADWKGIIDEALRQARLLGLHQEDASQELVSLKNTLERVQTVRECMKLKHLDKLSAALVGMEALIPDFPEIQDAINDFNKLQEIHHSLTHAMVHHNLPELEVAVQQAADQGLFEDATLKGAKEMLEKLKEVSSVLRAAKEAGTKEALDNAISRAEAAELKYDDVEYTACRNARASLLSFEERLQEAIDSRRLEELTQVLAQSSGESSLRDTAETLLALIRSKETAIKDAMQSGEFNQIAKAIDEAEASEIQCEALERAVVFLEETASAGLRAAIKAGSAADGWRQALEPLNVALAQADVVELSEDELAHDAKRLVTFIKTRITLASAVNEQSERMVNEAVKAATDVELPSDTPELEAALRFLGDVQDCGEALSTAITSRNTDLILAAIAEAQKMGMPESDPLVQQATTLVAKLKELKSGLKAAIKQGDVGLLETAIIEAESMLNKDNSELTAATVYLRKLQAFEDQLKDAVRARCYEDIDAALGRAEELGLTTKPSVLDAQGLFAQLSKANLALSEAIASGDIEQMDAALEEANKLEMKGHAFDMAEKRLENEAQRNLEAEIKLAMQKKASRQSTGAIAYDTGPILRALQRLRDLRVQAPELVTQASALLSKSKEQEEAAAELEKAINEKDTEGVKRAVKRGRIASLKEEFPAMNRALLWQKELIDSTENLTKACANRDIDALLAATEKAEIAGVNKEEAVWVEAKQLIPRLEALDQALIKAVEAGTLTAVTHAIQSAEDEKLAPATTSLTKARMFLEQVKDLEDRAENAIRKRRMSSLSYIVSRASELKQKESAVIINAKILHSEFEKLDERLKEAMKNPSATETMDQAILDAQNTEVDLSSLKQAVFQAEQSIRLQLGMLCKDVAMNKNKKQAHPQIRAALLRVSDLRIDESSSEIFGKARTLLADLDHKQDLVANLSKAFELKDMDKCRAILKVSSEAGISPKEQPIIQEAQDYLDRAPVVKEETKTTDQRRPLQHVRKLGYLDKKAQAFPYNWKARYFVLEGRALKYYEDAAGAHLPRGSVLIEGVELVKDSKAKVNGKESFKFKCGGNRKITLSASTLAERVAWIEAINTNLRIEYRINRVNNIFTTVGKNEVNIFDLGIVTQLAYLPDALEAERLMDTFVKKFPGANAGLNQIISLVKKECPQVAGASKELKAGWSAYFDFLMSDRRQETKAPEELLLMAYAVWTPPNDVVKEVCDYFRMHSSQGMITYYTFVAGLQKTDETAVDLCRLLHLSTPVPNFVRHDIEGVKTMAEAQIFGGTLHKGRPRGTRKSVFKKPRKNASNARHNKGAVTISGMPSI